MARIKTVYPTEQIAHLWMHKTQDSAKNPAGNFYFMEGVIFSYGTHFPIAKHTKTPDGKACILLTTKEYSPTTAKHIHYVRGAISKDYLVFRIDNVSACSTVIDKNSVRSYIKSAAENHIKANYGKKENRARYLEAAEENLTQANKVLEAYGAPKIHAIDIQIAIDHAEFSRTQILSHKKENKARQEQRRRDDLKQWEELVAEWQNGTRDSLPFWKAPVGAGILLRIKGDEIETSGGVSIPVYHAPLIWRMVRACKEKQIVYVHGEHALAAGVFKIDKIDAEGNVTAGCHEISFTQIEKIAKQLNLI